MKKMVILTYALLFAFSLIAQVTLKGIKLDATYFSTKSIETTVADHTGQVCIFTNDENLEYRLDFYYQKRGLLVQIFWKAWMLII